VHEGMSTSHKDPRLNKSLEAPLSRPIIIIIIIIALVDDGIFDVPGFIHAGM
jgi:hypothetical protein